MNSIKKLAPYLPLAIMAVPFVAGAQQYTLYTAVQTIEEIIRVLIPIAFGLIMVYFFWGLAKYVMAGGDEDKKKEGRSAMVYGVIGMFVAAAVWGIAIVIGNTFGASPGEQLQQLPNLPG